MSVCGRAALGRSWGEALLGASAGAGVKSSWPSLSGAGACVDSSVTRRPRGGNPRTPDCCRLRGGVDMGSRVRGAESVAPGMLARTLQEDFDLGGASGILEGRQLAAGGGGALAFGKREAEEVWGRGVRDARSRTP